jgi:hypothetical protein
VDAYFSKAALSNPFSNGPYSNLLALIPFVLLIGFLYLVAREKILSSNNASQHSA